MHPPKRNGSRMNAVALAVCWIATLAAVAIHAPLASDTVSASERLQSMFRGDVMTRLQFLAFLLIPPCSALGATIVVAQLTRTRASRDRLIALWTVLVLVALMGWPVSCVTGAAINYGGSSWIPR